LALGVCDPDHSDEYWRRKFTLDIYIHFFSELQVGMNLILKALFYFLCLSGLLFAQDSKIPNIAVIPFVGDKTVSAEQLNFITGKFATELMATKAFRILDRGKMEYILKEQGFQQSGACNNSECQLQMGQLLGVDFIVAGNLVRFGSKYAFRADYIEIGSGQVAFSVEEEESGDLEDVYATLCKGAAHKLAQEQHTKSVPLDLSAPKVTTEGTNTAPLPAHASLTMKRKIALALWGTTLLGAGSGFYFDRKGTDYADQYDAAKSAGDRSAADDAFANIHSTKTRRDVSYGVSISSFVIGAVLWFWPEGK